MKKTITGVLLMMPMMLFFARCNNNNSNADTMKADSSTVVKAADSSKMSSQDINTGGVTMAQNDFVNKAANAGMLEVALGNLAQTNASSQAVKDYGKMLATDHSDANKELMSITTAKNIAMPSSMDAEHSMHLKDLSEKKGAEFDKAYISMMVEGHTAVIEQFKKAAAENPVPEVKKFAQDKLPTLQGHLAKAKEIKAKM